VDFAERNSKNDGRCIFQVLYESDKSDIINTLIKTGSTISPFGALPYTDAFCKKYLLTYNGPPVDIVRIVNSKKYSTKIKSTLGIINISKIVSNCDELKLAGGELLGNGPFLIKDTYGVSGKGNLLISNESIFARILEYFSQQERQDRKVELVLEPLWEKKLDFSCQFYIDNTGNIKIISIQWLDNSDFVYHGSYTADEEFIKFLKKKDYFYYLERIGQQLYKDGYFGHVCLDSMILRNQEIVPIIEINARKSMSLVKHYLDKYLEKYSLKGNFTYYSLVCNREVQFEDILEKMQSEGILFKPYKGIGVFPVSANTFTINKRKDKPYKARLYVCNVTPDKDTEDTVIQKTRNVFNAFSIKVID
jgi:hypothetical protein